MRLLSATAGAKSGSDQSVRGPRMPEVRLSLPLFFGLLVLLVGLGAGGVYMVTRPTPTLPPGVPTPTLATTPTYTATITTGVNDLEGNQMAANYTWSFTTGSTADTTAPQVLSVVPQDGATNVPVNSSLSITFNEPVIPFTVGLIEGKTVTVTFDAAKTTATMTPTAPLQHSFIYTSRIQARDLAGNPVLATWSFTTQP